MIISTFSYNYACPNWHLIQNILARMIRIIKVLLCVNHLRFNAKCIIIKPKCNVGYFEHQMLYSQFFYSRSWQPILLTRTVEIF